jgi:hypothetical protein
MVGKPYGLEMQIWIFACIVIYFRMTRFVGEWSGPFDGPLISVAAQDS